jgi:membrane protein
MDFVKKSFVSRYKPLFNKVSEDNLFLLSSSIAYYSALALAPFALILLAVASFIGEASQKEIIKQSSVMLSSQVGHMLEMVFSNVNEAVNLGSISGLIGLVVLLFTASLVFQQFRYSFDVIYGIHDPKSNEPITSVIREKIFAMFFVLMSAIVFIASLVASGIFLEIFASKEGGLWRSMAVLYLNFMIYLGMFTAVHYYIPSKRYPIIDTLKKAALTAIFFMIGNFLLAFYLKKTAADSLYGAAGALLVFLTWAYYSSFIIFLSVVVFLHLKKMKLVN